MNTFNPAAMAALAKGDLLNAVIASQANGIEMQEKAGQQEIVKLQRLPREGMHKYKYILEEIGFVVGKIVDEIFVECQFPEGWRLEATDHDMWSNLLDNKGRLRGKVFYKAAFYDRRASFNLVPRFQVHEYVPTPSSYISSAEKNRCCVAIKSGGSIIQTFGEYESTDFNLSNELANQARKWLEENYPDHEDLTAYWD